MVSSTIFAERCELLQSKTCLIVDDEPAIRVYIKVVLERQHYETLEAENGIEALVLVKKLGGTLDLIVSDVRMPGGDGVTFASSVRELFPAIPIILMSGYTEVELQRPAISFAFVQKPFLPDILMSAIDNATMTLEFSS